MSDMRIFAKNICIAFLMAMSLLSCIREELGSEMPAGEDVWVSIDF